MKYKVSGKVGVGTFRVDVGFDIYALDEYDAAYRAACVCKLIADGMSARREALALDLPGEALSCASVYRVLNVTEIKPGEGVE